LLPYRFHAELDVPAARPAVFDFFSRAENLERITPRWLHFRILTPAPILRQGAQIAYALRLHGIAVDWLTEIERWEPPLVFVDVQKKGPYRMWRHRHRFEEAGSGTRIVDDVEYALPFGPLGALAHPFVHRDIARIFKYRAERVRELIG
jgi:ligand-binding SRPBCC domain-containing protein